MIRRILYFVYIAFARHTPDQWRPYALFFPRLRSWLVCKFARRAGRNVVVKSGADISPNIEIGSRSEIGCRALIYGGVTIGDDVLMGPDVKIITRNHVFSSAVVPIREQGDCFSPVEIHDDVWIGANVVILPGVVIGRGAVIAAGAVVADSVNVGEIVGGVPAKKIGTRFHES